LSIFDKITININTFPSDDLNPRPLLIIISSWKILNGTYSQRVRHSLVCSKNSCNVQHANGVGSFQSSIEYTHKICSWEPSIRQGSRRPRFTYEIGRECRFIIDVQLLGGAPRPCTSGSLRKWLSSGARGGLNELLWRDSTIDFRFPRETLGTGSCCRRGRIRRCPLTGGNRRRGGLICVGPKLSPAHIDTNNVAPHPGIIMDFRPRVRCFSERRVATMIPWSRLSICDWWSVLQN